MLPQCHAAFDAASIPCHHSRRQNVEQTYTCTTPFCLQLWATWNAGKHHYLASHVMSLLKYTGIGMS